MDWWGIITRSWPLLIADSTLSSVPETFKKEKKTCSLVLMVPISFSFFSWASSWLPYYLLYMGFAEKYIVGIMKGQQLSMIEVAFSFRLQVVKLGRPLVPDTYRSQNLIAGTGDDGVFGLTHVECDRLGKDVIKTSNWRICMTTFSTDLAPFLSFSPTSLGYICAVHSFFRHYGLFKREWQKIWRIPAKIPL